jgi:hypothetical protein
MPWKTWARYSRRALIVDRLEWIAPGSARHKRTTAEFVPAYLPKIKRRKQESLQFDAIPETAEHAVHDIPMGCFSHGFLMARTIEQLIADQHVRPIANVSILSGGIPDEDVDLFVAEIYRDRNG